MKVKLKHLRTLDVAQANVLENVKCYDSLDEAIRSWGVDGGEVGSETYNDRVGAAFEVFTEFFYARYGTASNPLLGVTDVSHTSQDPMQCGFDFDYTDLSGDRGIIQSKWRSNPMRLFSLSELGTFIGMADGEGIPSHRRILFTNLEHSPSDSSNGVFHRGFKHARNQMRVMGRSQQVEFIDRDPNFWPDLLISVLASAKPPKTTRAPKMRLHQLEAFEGVLQVMK